MTALPAPSRPDQQRWRDADELRWAVRHWAVRIGVRAPSVHVRALRTKWASISTAGRLTLDASLLNLPRSLGEYVLVHELVHLLVPNHSKLMKSFLAAYLPDWPERERELRLVAGGRRARGQPAKPTALRLPRKLTPRSR